MPCTCHFVGIFISCFACAIQVSTWEPIYDESGLVSRMTSMHSRSRKSKCPSASTIGIDLFPLSYSHWVGLKRADPDPFNVFLVGRHCSFFLQPWSTNTFFQHSISCGSWGYSDTGKGLVNGSSGLDLRADN